MLKRMQRREPTQYLTILAPALLALLLGATGCGAQTYSQSRLVGRPGVGVGYDQDSGSWSPGSSSGSGTSGPGAGALTYPIQGLGYTSVSVKVSTHRKLKVKFTPGKQNKATPGTGITHYYSALGVFIGVGDNLQPTTLLNNGFYGGQAETSAVIDLAGTFDPTCPESDTACRQTVTITVTKPNNDDACLNSSYWFCPYAHVPDGHPWNGTLVVETDDTGSI